MNSSSTHSTDKSKSGRKLAVINIQIWYTHRWCPLQLSALNKSTSLVCQNIVNTLLETVCQSQILKNKFWYEIACYIGTSVPLCCLRLFIRLVAGFERVLNERKCEDSQLRSHFIHPFFIIVCSRISLIEPLFSLSCTRYGCSREGSVQEHFVKKD